MPANGLRDVLRSIFQPVGEGGFEFIRGAFRILRKGKKKRTDAGKKKRDTKSGKQAERKFGVVRNALGRFIGK